MWCIWYKHAHSNLVPYHRLRFFAFFSGNVIFFESNAWFDDMRFDFFFLLEIKKYSLSHETWLCLGYYLSVCHIIECKHFVSKCVWKCCFQHLTHFCCSSIQTKHIWTLAAVQTILMSLICVSTKCIENGKKTIYIYSFAWRAIFHAIWKCLILFWIFG